MEIMEKMNVMMKSTQNQVVKAEKETQCLEIVHAEKETQCSERVVKEGGNLVELGGNLVEPMQKVEPMQNVTLGRSVYPLSPIVIPDDEDVGNILQQTIKADLATTNTIKMEDVSTGNTIKHATAITKPTPIESLFLPPKSRPSKTLKPSFSQVKVKQEMVLVSMKSMRSPSVYQTQTRASKKQKK
jgi:hypothetical protein